MNSNPYDIQEAALRYIMETDQGAAFADAYFKYREIETTLSMKDIVPLDDIEEAVMDTLTPEAVYMLRYNGLNTRKKLLPKRRRALVLINILARTLGIEQKIAKTYKVHEPTLDRLTNTFLEKLHEKPEWQSILARATRFTTLYASRRTCHAYKIDIQDQWLALWQKLKQSKSLEI